jgi:hypothetical protein
MSGENTGPGHPIAGDEGQLHLLGAPQEQQCCLVSDHKAI